MTLKFVKGLDGQATETGEGWLEVYMPAEENSDGELVQEVMGFNPDMVPGEETGKNNILEEYDALVSEYPESFEELISVEPSYRGLEVHGTLRTSYNSSTAAVQRLG